MYFSTKNENVVMYGKKEGKRPLQFVKRFTPFEKIGWVEKIIK